MGDIYSAKPWLKFYDPHVPEHLTYDDKSYARLFIEAAELLPGRAAVIYMGRTITFGQLDRLSNQFARFLKDRGLKPGDTVGVNLPNIPAYYIAIAGIMKAGCVLSGVSPLLSAKELEYQLNDSGAKVLVTLDLLFGKAAEVVAGTPVKTVLVAGIADFLPPVKKFLGTLLKKIPTGEVHPIGGVLVSRYLDALSPISDDRVEEKIDPGAAALMQYTGGTTGPPKGALLTHKNLTHHIAQIKVWMQLVVGRDKVLSAFPLFHQAGLFIGMMSMALGITQVAIPNPRDIDFIIKAIDKEKPNGIVNVPTIFLELLKRPGFRALDFSTVVWFVSGAAPFPPEYIGEFESVVGKGKLVEVVGMTETTPVLTSLPRFGTKKAGSVGIPYPDTDVRLVDPETRKPAPQGEPGELVARGPQVFTLGYHNKPEETAHTLRDGWIYTGDVCTMDEDGYFYVVDRLKDMVNVSGFKVFTRTVDDALMEHPDIDMAATIGLPDPNKPGSEIVATAIVLKQGIEKTEAQRNKIIDYMKGKVAPYKVPKRVDFMDVLPTSAVGKILKRELRKEMAGK
ncbi:MAG: AMP-binding protein [Deltaproteobacteria bacterium]|nr:AMP-binding protein [Candidatus Zymogenaceae bacterium]